MPISFKQIRSQTGRPLTRFILTLLVLVLAGLALRYLYHASPGVNHFIQHSRFIDTFYRVLIGSTAYLLSLAGVPHQVGYDGQAIQYFIRLSETNYLLYLWIPCLGITLMYIYASLIIAFPGTLKRKTAYVITGWLIIQLLNVLRLFGIALLLANDHSGKSYLARNNWFVLNHEDLFNYFVIFLIFLVFVSFTKSINNKKIPTP
jgi:exosortase/archaeosortase family protein